MAIDWSNTELKTARAALVHSLEEAERLLVTAHGIIGERLETTRRAIAGAKAGDNIFAPNATLWLPCVGGAIVEAGIALGEARDRALSVLGLHSEGTVR